MCLPLLACFLLVVLQRVSREHLGAVLALGRQLRDRLLDRQVPRSRDLGDLDAAVGAGRVRLVAETRVSEQVREARRAHQVPVATLQ